PTSKPAPTAPSTPPPAPTKVAVGNGDSQVDVAARANNDGVGAFAAKRYGDASMKFKEAVARVPEPRYFFHLCLSLYQEGKFNEALVACDAVHHQPATPDLGARADTELDRIRAEAHRQGIDLQAP